MSGFQARAPNLFSFRLFLDQSRANHVPTGSCKFIALLMQYCNFLPQLYGQTFAVWFQGVWRIHQTEKMLKVLSKCYQDALRSATETISWAIGASSLHPHAVWIAKKQWIDDTRICFHPPGPNPNREAAFREYITRTLIASLFGEQSSAQSND